MFALLQMLSLPNLKAIFSVTSPPPLHRIFFRLSPPPHEAILFVMPPQLAPAPLHHKKATVPNMITKCSVRTISSKMITRNSLY